MVKVTVADSSAVVSAGVPERLAVAVELAEWSVPLPELTDLRLLPRRSDWRELTAPRRDSLCLATQSHLH